MQENVKLHEAKVLLVDDRHENLVSLEGLLAGDNESITYILADSGEEALKVALKEELALIMLDVQMPGMNGYEVAQYLRNNSRTRNIPIIFVTAIDQDTSNMVEGFEAGAIDFLFKPLHPYITKAKVRAFVNFYRQKKELEAANKHVLELNERLEKRVEERTQELLRINNDLDNFIYTASHDLKAPINNIEGLLELFHQHLNELTDDQQEVGEIMDRIYGSISRFKRTLFDLTEVAKVQEDTTDKSDISFAEMLEEVKLTIKDLIREFKAEIIEDFSAAPTICFSRKNLRSVLYNLVSNAIKYSSPDRKPVIKLSSHYQQDFIVMKVQDNGLGISEKDQDKLFQMFKRLHTHVEGTGVGMAIVKRIIENNDGKIHLKSTPGEGTTFTVCFKAGSSQCG